MGQKYIIVGATGYIGAPLLRAAGMKGIAIGTSSNGAGHLLKLDLAVPESFEFDLINAGDTIFVTAALSAPDVCAKEHDRAWSVNVSGTIHLIQEACARGAHVIFFSSDTVYGESSTSLIESSPCSPSGDYGVMKRTVEEFFAHEPLFKAIRLSYVFSKDDKFTRYLADCVNNDRPAELFHPFYRSIIHREDVINGVLALSAKWGSISQRYINFGGPESISRIDFASILKENALRKLEFTVTEPDETFFTNRPRMINMCSEVLPQILGREQHSLAEAVQIEFEN